MTQAPFCCDEIGIFQMRKAWMFTGRNLGETLHALPNHDLKAVVDATRSVVGLPTDIEPRESEDRFYFVQKEPGLQFTVNQMGVSSGTLRVLALMTALYAQPDTTLIGIEEPENYIHPSALQALVQHLRDATGRVQFMVTTHSPVAARLSGRASGGKRG